MPDVIRRTSAGVEDRVRRILERDGIDVVLAEVSRIAVPDVRRMVLVELLAQRTASELPRKRLLAAARQELATDEPALAAFLVDLIVREGAAGEIPRQVLDEVSGLRRGSSRFNVMEAMIQHPDSRVRMAALGAIDLVAEDVWRRDLLEASARHVLGADAQQVDAWFTALAALRSPMYRRELLEFIRAQELPSRVVARATAELG
jgi:hypothetical protein